MEELSAAEIQALIDKETQDRRKIRENIERMRGEIELFETTVKIKVMVRQEEEIARIGQVKEDLNDRINFVLESERGKSNNDLRYELEEYNHKLEAEIKMSSEQVKTQENRVTALEE